MSLLPKKRRVFLPYPWGGMFVMTKRIEKLISNYIELDEYLQLEYPRCCLITQILTSLGRLGVTDRYTFPRQL